MFRLEAKIFSREKRGRSVIAAAAYRAGVKLKDEIQNKIFDYTRRSRGVIDTLILAPEGAPVWATDSSKLWNAVEAGEKRVDAQLAREFILAVPPELPADAQFQTAVGWAQTHLVDSGNRQYLFPNQNRPTTFMSQNTMIFALYRMGYHRRTTGHGFRATASTILNEHGFTPDLIERQLAHVERNKVRAAYNHAQYLPERRKMMQWWVDYIDGIA